MIPHSLWRTFVDAANNPDTTDAETALYQVRYTRQLFILERFMILYNISSNQWNMNLEFAVRFSVTVTSALITNVFFSGRERASTSQSRHPGLPDSPPAEGRGQRRLQDVRRQSLHGHGPHHCRILIQVRNLVISAEDSNSEFQLLQPILPPHDTNNVYFLLDHLVNSNLVTLTATQWPSCPRPTSRRPLCSASSASPQTIGPISCSTSQLTWDVTKNDLRVVEFLILTTV